MTLPGTHPATSGHGKPAADACSVQWDRDGTSAYGTAAVASFFVIVEQSGPWGRNAARESHLGAALGAELEARCAGAGGRLMLVRGPGGHPDDGGQRRVLVAHTGAPGRPAWLLRAEVATPASLLSLDWTGLARGRRDAVGASLPGAVEAQPQLLVCTNGRRDVCCAVRGRPLAAAAARVAPGRAWEVSHTGGHRFAPTAVLLPWGLTFARLDDSTVALLLESSTKGQVPTELLGPVHDRGRSALPQPAQCAESHVRALTGETRIDALAATVVDQAEEAEDEHLVEVTHGDGRAWRVRVRRAPAGHRLPESCGKGAIEVLEYTATVEPPATH